MNIADSYPVKEYVEDFSFSTVKLNRSTYSVQNLKKNVINNYGKLIEKNRKCYMPETLQAVTMIGLKYKVTNIDENKKEHKKTVLFVGITKQNPKDPILKNSKALKISNEYASINALNCPIAVIDIPKDYDQTAFNYFASNYIRCMKLEYLH